MKRCIVLLGSTGSVGRNAVSLLKEFSHYFEVVALTAHQNVTLLIEQARALHPKRVVISDPSCFSQLKDALPDIEVSVGPDAVLEAASMPCDVVLSALLGISALAPTLKALEHGRIVGLANKESLVIAGDLVMKTAHKHSAQIIPVDSEHSALFQIMSGQRSLKNQGVETLTLTASGGPFFAQEIREPITKEMALKHPRWSMGAKISIDSATWMNKGLEIIEAHHLFLVPYDKIDVCVHPESMIHALVTYVDGSMIAHLGVPDMRGPISYALSWPDRMKTSLPRLDLPALSKLTFFKPDMEKFPCLRLAKESALANTTLMLNAANDIAVEAFLQEKMAFSDIPRLIEEMLSDDTQPSASSLEDILSMDQECRRLTTEKLRSRFSCSR